MIYSGGCHCGAVRFEVDAPESLTLTECNCSICSKTAYLHLIVPKSRFKLLTDWQAITTYTFNTAVAQHYFCSTCGIKSFYIPRSNPAGYSVNARCLDTLPENVHLEKFDGQHWEENAHQLANRDKT